MVYRQVNTSFGLSSTIWTILINFVSINYLLLNIVNMSSVRMIICSLLSLPVLDNDKLRDYKPSSFWISVSRSAVVISIT